MSIQHIFPINNWDFKSESILAGLPPDDLERLMAQKSEHVYKKGEILFREGAYPSGLFYIVEGRVKKYKTDKMGKDQIFYVANDGELLGFHAILSEQRYPDSAATLGKSTIIFIPKEDFIYTLHQSPALNSRLLKTLCHEFAVLTNSITLFSRNSVRERLALQLIILREKYKINFEPGMIVEINISREDLASLTGTARENVIRILSEFKEAGIVETKGSKIRINDIQKLISLVNVR